MTDLRELQDLERKIADEGDRQEWVSSGYGCFMRRTDMLSWCGYVSVPADHPWSGVSYSDHVTPLPHVEHTLEDIAPPLMSLLIQAFGKERSDRKVMLDSAVRVHGGVTWSSPRGEIRGQEGTEWTFGFDCAHANDLVPGVARVMPAALHIKGDVYRDRDYVFAETSRLAAQLRLVHQRGTP